MPLDLFDADSTPLVALLRETIEGDRFPLSPRIRGKESPRWSGGK
jgi:hypothetical protein